MQKRFIFINGPWQLLYVASILKQVAEKTGITSQDHLFFISPFSLSPLSPTTLETMHRIAPLVWPWSRVVTLPDVADQELEDIGRSIPHHRDLLGSESPDELWLECLWGIRQKVLAETYRESDIVLYEEGLQTYMPAEDYPVSLGLCLKEPRRAYRGMKLRLRERRFPEKMGIATMLPRHLSRVKESYLWISLMLPPADFQKRLPWVQVETRFLHETFKQVAPIVDELNVGLDTPENPGRKRAVILGQCFSNYGDLTRETELGCYIEIAEKLQEMGYDPIWKEHPRTREPFLEDLAAAIPGIQAFPELGPWPIELFVDRLNLRACAGLISTSMFTIPLLFDHQSYSLAGRYESTFRFPNNVLARLVTDWIPQLDDARTLAAAGGPTPRMSSAGDPV